MKLVSSPVLLLLGVLACAALIPAAEARLLPLIFTSVWILGSRCSGLTQDAGTKSPSFLSCWMPVELQHFSASSLRMSANFGDVETRQDISVNQKQKMHLAEYAAQPISLIPNCFTAWSFS